jgi:hypothetical protein
MPTRSTGPRGGATQTLPACTSGHACPNGPASNDQQPAVIRGDDEQTIVDEHEQVVADRIPGAPGRSYLLAF